jgi:hypothetical protein
MDMHDLISSENLISLDFNFDFIRKWLQYVICWVISVFYG